MYAKSLPKYYGWVMAFTAINSYLHVLDRKNSYMKTFKIYEANAQNHKLLQFLETFKK